MPLTKAQINEIFEKNQITLEDMETVASSPKLKVFDSIHLSGKGITDEIGLVLICSKHIGGLLELNLSKNNLTDKFVKSLLKKGVLPKLEKLNLRFNRVTSAVISSLINNFDKHLKELEDDYITTICGISICDSSYGNMPRWIKLADRCKEEDSDGVSMDLQGIIDFINNNTNPSNAEVVGTGKSAGKKPALLQNRTFDRCIGGAMAGSDSLVVNKLYAVEDFFYLEHSMEGDQLFEFEKEAFEEADRLKSLYEDEDEDEDEDEAEDEGDVIVYDPLNLSEKEEKERASYIAEVEKQCRVRAKELGLPGVEEQELSEDVRLEMVLIPAGKFKMGSPESEKARRNDEKQHEVTLTKPFYMGKHEVTQEQWEAVMGSNPSSKTKGAKLPVTDVSWEDCQEFIKKLNAKTNGGYRLPTEAEWEYACRAGTTTAYSVGDEITPKDANYKDSKINKSVEVGSYKPNAFGLYDMHGNVFEWCEDWKVDYPAGAVTDPKAPATGTYRVVRGGSFITDESFARSSNRIALTPTARYCSDGFRLARTL